MKSEVDSCKDWNILERNLYEYVDIQCPEYVALTDECLQIKVRYFLYTKYNDDLY